jgi:signal transduction histidine kinase/response regulator RpfG family c-di-GMP phosphodiesterase
MRNYVIILLIFAFTVPLLTTPCYALNENIIFTEEELDFLEKHPVIRVGVDPDFIPFEFIDSDGEYKGIAADYISLISERTGIEFEIIKGLTWPEAYDGALAGRIDVLPAISRTQERELYFLFSEPYYYFKRVIVTRDTETRFSGIEDLEGQTVAVQRNSSHHSYLLSYPNINLSLYDSVELALTAVANGTERVFVGNLATSNYLIRSTGLTNLKFTAFEAELQQALYFAVRQDWPLLVSILNKTLDTITLEERIAINNKWVDLETDIDYGPIIRIITIAGSFLAVIIAVSFYWIARLRKEVRRRELLQLDLEKAKQEADEANEFKSSFMARMSHEIRTPLNAITGMAYLLKKTEVTLTQIMYIDRITQAANNMLSIINDIMDISKIEAGKVELETISFSMDQVIQDAVNIVSYKIEEQGIGFKLSKDPALPNWFYGDPKRIGQILLNILNNAAKFTNAGEVSLDVRLVAHENGHYHISFTIRDTGVGMTESQVEKLFLPFIQGDSSINRKFGGSGLGMSIVKNLLDMMGGKIQVFSTLGEGSTFIVFLKLTVDKENEDIYRKTMSASHFKNMNTLVLEKTGANMNLIESYLSAFGMQSELTTSQASALSMLEAADGKFAKGFDLFIFDYDTPQEGGFKFAESIRSNKKIVKQPKLIMLLPMMRGDLFDRLFENGIDLNISKPIIPSVLLNGILDIFNLKAISASQLSVNKMDKRLMPEKMYKVLLVEDNKTNQLIAKSILKEIGIDSILAGDGKSAVELYQQHMNDIDLILMDLHMPVMNGYEAAQEIRKISNSIPIVAMTADVIMGVREKCEQSGIHYYISKPFDPEHFIQTVVDIITAHKSDKLQNTDVLDTKKGLNNIGGDLEVYRQVLNEYYKENQETLQLFGDAIREKRYSHAAQLVHKVKGSSGSIGAESLYKVSVKLQKALSTDQVDEIMPLADDFSRQLKRLLTEIEELTEKMKKPDIIREVEN